MYQIVGRRPARARDVPQRNVPTKAVHLAEQPQTLAEFHFVRDSFELFAHGVSVRPPGRDEV